MKIHHYFIAIFSVLVCAMPSFAATLTWDRNAEPDMANYSIYACFTPGCVVSRSAGTHQGVTPQTPVGAKPIFELDLAGKEGAAAVTATDTAGNESEISVPVPFDKVAPRVPVNPILR